MAAAVRNILKCRPQFASRRARLVYRSFSSSTEKEDSTVNTDGFRSTHFGFEDVPEEEKVDRVYKVFENVAEKYDIMNDAMSVGIHRLWKDSFMQRLAPSPGTQLIDVAGGTGDIAFRFLDFVKTEVDRHGDSSLSGSPLGIDLPEYVQTLTDSGSSDDSELDNVHKKANLTHVTVCDINQAMLDVGKQRAQRLGYIEGVSWLKGNAECLPVEDNSFDAYTIAFGIRNTTHIDKVLSEAYRVLRPGGRFMCLEFSQVTNPLLRSMYDQYSFQVIPVLGQLIAQDWKSYQYLVESIRKFPTQEDFVWMIRDAGFSAVRYENLTFGVAAIHSGFKMDT